VRYRALGRTGLAVSEVGFGCGVTAGLMVEGDAAAQAEAVGRALALGINYFDTAPIYGDQRSERNLGAALRATGAMNHAPTRSRPIVATKLVLELADLADVDGAVRRSVAGSLERLGRERLDVLQLHNRVAAERAARPNTGVGALLSVADVLGREGVLASMQRLQAEGLVGFLGCCAYGGEMAAVRALLDTGAFDVLLAHYSLLNPSAAEAAGAGGQDEEPSARHTAAPGGGGGQDYEQVMQHAAAGGVGVAVIRALEAGALTGQPRRSLAGRGVAPGYAVSVARAAALEDGLAARGWAAPTEAAIRYVLAEPAVSTVVLGFSEVAHVEQAAAYAARGPLAEDNRAWVRAVVGG
jgi:aryl-alcohol dehydrogenase-like predicted oxidoreductase